MNRYFPIFLDISKKKILIVGAGNIAKRRLKSLILYTKNLKIIAKKVDEEIEKIARDYYIDIEIRQFRKEDLCDIDIVFALSDDKKLNSDIFKIEKKKNILCNSASNKDECDFYFPSLIVDKDLSIAINCNGKEHKKVKEIRKNIEERLNIDNKIKY